MDHGQDKQGEAPPAAKNSIIMKGPDSALPDDAWAHVYTFAPYRDLEGLMSVNKTFQSLGKPYINTYKYWNLRACEVSSQGLLWTSTG